MGNTTSKTILTDLFLSLLCKDKEAIKNSDIECIIALDIREEVKLREIVFRTLMRYSIQQNSLIH